LYPISFPFNRHPPPLSSRAPYLLHRSLHLLRVLAVIRIRYEGSAEMAKPSADDAELRRACVAAVAALGARGGGHLLHPRCQGPRHLREVGRHTRPRVLTLTGQQLCLPAAASFLGRYAQMRVLQEGNEFYRTWVLCNVCETQLRSHHVVLGTGPWAGRKFCLGSRKIDAEASFTTTPPLRRRKIARQASFSFYRPATPASPSANRRCPTATTS
jgi:hypothetical protein